MTYEDRVRLEALWSAGRSVPQIAQQLGRHRSTVHRELARHNSYRHGVKNPLVATLPFGRQGLYRWGYLAQTAQTRARLNARRPKQAVCARGGPLREPVLQMLQDRFSPQQITARLRLLFPDQPERWVSHETIYQAVYVQSRGGLRDVLTRQVALRSGRHHRRPATAGAGALRSTRAWARDFNISQRPAHATDRAVPGHWEGDLVVGARGASAIVTLVERSTRFVLLGALPDGRASEAVIDVLSDLIGRLPVELRQSLTWDNGPELAQHARFSVVTGCPVFFADPYKPWQRGSNENTNGLLRQYFPKGQTDFRTLTQPDLDQVAQQLNRRPRETLGFHTPSEKLNELLVATAA